MPSSDGNSMTDTPEPAKYARLRTTIIVVSMIVMPLCAVVGVKMPKFLNDKMNDSSTAAGPTAGVDPKTKPTARPSGSRPEKNRDRLAATPLNTASPLNTPTSLAQADADHSTHDHAPHDHSDHDQSNRAQLPGSVQQASAAAETYFPPANSDVRATASGVSQAVALEAVGAGGRPVDFEQTGTIRPLPVTLDEATKPTATSAATPSHGGAGSSDQFSLIQSRLKALGATHYTLETWGASGNSYRFQCRMAAGHSADYTRQFEATDNDPLRTMQTVLDEVEAWKAGRLP